MSTLLNFGRDINGYNAYAPQFSTDMFSATLTNGSEKTLTIPSNFHEWIMVVSAPGGSSIWVAHNATAAVPAGASFASTTSELNPGPRTVYSGDVIHFITDNTSVDVGVILYAKQNS